MTLFAGDGTDLLIKEGALFGNGQFEDITLDELGFAGVVGRYGVGFAVGTDHILTVKNALDNLAEGFFAHDRGDVAVIAD